MNKKTKFIIFLVATIISVITSVCLLSNNLTTFAIITITLSIILFIVTITNVPKEQTIESMYSQELKTILKRYDAILAEIGNIPNLEDKNIMLITNIEDMIDAAVEIRKPVYYKKEDGYCVFTLLDNQDMCLYLLKQEKEKTTAVEDFINNRKESIEKNIADSKERKENSIEEERIATSFTEISNNNIEEVKEINEDIKQEEIVEDTTTQIENEITEKEDMKSIETEVTVDEDII